MGYDKVASDLAIVDEQIAELKIKLDPTAEIVQQMTLVREFLADKAQFSIA